MFKSLGKNITKSLVIWIFIWLWIFISYATDISFLSQTVVTWDKITKDWFNAVNSWVTFLNTSITNINNKLVNIYNDWTNIGIWTATPATKLHIDSGTVLISKLWSPRLALVDTTLWSATTAPARLIDNSADIFRVFRQPNISTNWTAYLIINNSGSIWIWTTTPTQKLEVAWRVKATNIETNGSYVITRLSHCSWPCASYHAINTWINVGAYNYTWITPINTDTATFTSNNHWVITVNKTWLYLVHETVMMIPNSDRARISHWCPFINWAASCWNNSPADYVTHRYYPNGRWASEQYNLYFQLNAWDTVSYWYYIYWAMNYWAHDGYTSMRITRVN